MKLLRRAERPAAGNDDPGRGELRTLGRGDALAHEGREAGIGRRGIRSRPAPMPPLSAAGKEAVRTVMTFLASVDFTVWMALPA